MGLEPGARPYRELKRPHGLGRASPLVWDYSSLFQAQRALSRFCLKCVQHMAAVQPHCSICPPREGTQLHPLPLEQGTSRTDLHRPQERPTGLGEPVPAAEVDLALPLLCEHSTVPPRASPLCAFLRESHTRMQWADVFPVSPGTDGQCTVLCLTHLLINYKQ